MSKQIKIGIFIQYFQIFIGTILNLIFTSIMLKTLEKVEYGIYNLSSSIVSYLNLLSLGLGAGYIRYYSIYKRENNEDGIKSLNGMYFIIFLFLALVACVIGVSLSLNVKIFFNDSYTKDNIELAKILMIIMTFNLAITLLSSIFTSYIISQERFVFQKCCNLIRSILTPCLCIVMLKHGYGSIGLILVSLSMTILIELVNMLYCIFFLKMKFKFGKFNSVLFKELLIFCSFIAINQLIDQINWQTDKIILGKMKTGVEVAIYAIGATINSLYIQFSTTISSMFTPKIHQIANSNIDEEEKRNQFTNLMIKVGKIQFMVIMLILTGFIFFGKYFIQIWAGDGYEQSYYVTLLLICPITIDLIQNVGIEIQRALNKHKFRSIAYLFMALINVIISIFMCKRFSVIGVALGTTISLVVTNGFIINIYFQKKLKINIIKFWISILKIIPFLILPVLFGIYVYEYNYTNFYVYFGFIALYTLIYIISMSLYILIFEKKIFKRKKIIAK